MNSREILSTLNAGETRKILEVSHSDASIKKRMMYLGILKGQAIEVLLKATSQSGPLTVKIRGTVIALRKNEADSIYVEGE